MKSSSLHSIPEGENGNLLKGYLSWQTKAFAILSHLLAGLYCSKIAHIQWMQRQKLKRIYGLRALFELWYNSLQTYFTAVCTCKWRGIFINRWYQAYKERKKKTTIKDLFSSDCKGFKSLSIHFKFIGNVILRPLDDSKQRKIKTPNVNKSYRKEKVKEQKIFRDELLLIMPKRGFQQHLVSKKLFENFWKKKFWAQQHLSSM